MQKVSWFYEKVHNIANFGGYAAILAIPYNFTYSLTFMQKQSQ